MAKSPMRVTVNGIVIQALAKVWLDGVGQSGDTYIVESAANVVDHYAGGVKTLSLNAAGAAVTGTLSVSGLASFGITNKLYALESGATSYFTTAANGVGQGVFANATQSGLIVAGSAVATATATALTLGAGVNLVMASGKGIDFSATSNGSGTTTSEVLSDYEEGTWTPTIILGGGSVTYTTQTGSYTKVGRLVTVQVIITVNVATTPSNTLEFGGLPFTVAATQKGAASMYASGVAAGATTTWVGAPTPSTTNLRIYTYAAGVLTNPGAYLANGCTFGLTATYEV